MVDEVVSLVVAAVTMASVEGPRRRALEEFATTAVVEREHVDVHMISFCEQTAADARVHRREAPQETENR